MILSFLLLSGCVATTKTGDSTPVTPTTPSLTSTSSSSDLLYAIIEVSDPQSSTYDPNSASYANFPDAVKQLAALKQAQNFSVAGELAYAMSFPRQDSYLAAQPLLSLGPDWVTTTLPILISNLKDQNPVERAYSALVMGTVGQQASCALGDIGPLLWDADPYVRTSAAVAIVNITGKALVPTGVTITPDFSSAHPVPPDTPEGSIVAGARDWWTNQGSTVNWHPSYDTCDP
jgi:HEAT repeat protein